MHSRVGCGDDLVRKMEEEREGMIREDGRRSMTGGRCVDGGSDGHD